jgi:2-oxoisovalerate dehydrogenase E1 component
LTFSSPDEVEDAFFPFPSDILDAVHQYIEPLSGYTVKRTCDSADLLRRSAEGV